MLNTQPRALSSTSGDGDSTERKMQIQEHPWSWTRLKDRKARGAIPSLWSTGRSQGSLKSEKATAGMLRSGLWRSKLTSPTDSSGSETFLVPAVNELC